ncbi:MAG: patatin family protein, partial [Streptococcus gallolyticus]|nr:patatin family protein [Streptococcus gallolyticus]
YNNSIEHISNLENKGELFAIRPSQNLEIGRLETNPDKYEEIYQIGVKDTKAIMEQLKDYLAND